MAEAAANNNLAVKRSVVRVLLLSLLSFGLYGLYWQYVTREQLDGELGEERGLKQSPAMQIFGPLALILVGTLLMIIIIGFVGVIAGVILAYVVMYHLFNDISKARQKVGLQPIPAGLYLVLAIFIWPLAIGLAVNKYNEYWDKKTNGQATNAPFGGGEIAVIVAGIVMWVLYFLVFAAIIAAALGADKANDDLEDALKQLEQNSYSVE